MENIEENLPPDESVDGGMGLLVRQKRLYHGSGTRGIERLNPTEETTVGEGIYFTSKPDDALGYAKRRSRNNKEKSEPVVYGTQIENLKFLDLRNKENITHVLEGLKPILLEQRKSKGLSWHYETTLDGAIEAIASGNVSNLKQVTFSHGKLFTDYVKSLGYDGLVTIEGGEGEDVREHDTYLVFDVDKIKELSVV